jgi:predicted RNase H-like HicB family nuclease
MKLQVLLHSAEEGGYWAEIPAFAGCISEGETLEETLLNIKEAAEGWLEVAAMRIANQSQSQVAVVSYEIGFREDIFQTVTDTWRAVTAYLWQLSYLYSP